MAEADVGGGVLPRSPTGSARSCGSGFGWCVLAITVGAVGVGVRTGASGDATPAEGISWLLFAGSSLHVAATLGLFRFRAVRQHALRYPGRYQWAPAGLLAVAVTGSLLPAPGRTVTLFAFFGWQLWHYQKQNLGLASLATASVRLPALRPVERRCIVVSGIAGILALVANPGVLQIVAWRPPEFVAATAYALAAVVLVASIATGVAFVVSRWVASTTSAQAAAVYLIAVSFPIPLVLTRSPYAALGGLTLAHGFQYLLLVGHVLAGPPSPRRTLADLAGLVAVLAVVVAAGGVLGAVSHVHGSDQIAARVLFGAYLAAVMTHFVLDAGLWRLHDEFSRRWLTERVPHLLGLPSD